MNDIVRIRPKPLPRPIRNIEFLSADMRPADLITILEGFDTRRCCLRLDRGVKTYLLRLIKERGRHHNPMQQLETQYAGQ
jgi:hypothetical protein